MAKDSGLIMKLKQMSEHNHTTEQQRWELNRNLRDIDEMAKVKVRTLEVELEQQEKFFKKQEQNYEL